MQRVILFQILFASSVLTLESPTCSETKQRYKDSKCCENPERRLSVDEETVRRNVKRYVDAQGARMVAMGFRDSTHDYNFYFEGDETQIVTSNSIAKPVLSIVAGAMEERYPDFRVESLLVKDCLPPSLTGPASVLSKPGLVLDDLMSMQAGVITDGASTVSLFPGALGLKFLSDTGQAAAIQAAGLFLLASATDMTASDTLLGRIVQPNYTSTISSDPLQILAQLLTVQYRVDDIKLDTDDNSRIKSNFDFSKPVESGYSTTSVDLAGMCVQRFVSEKETGNPDSFDLLTFEKYVRTHVLDPIGMHAMRIGGVNDFALFGAHVYATIPEYLKIFDILHDSDGVFNGMQVIRREFLDSFRKGYDAYVMLDRYKRKYFRCMSMWRYGSKDADETQTFFQHGGVGGHAVYTDGETRGYGFVHIPISPLLEEIIKDHERPVILYASTTEVLRLSSVTSTPQVYGLDYENTTAWSHQYGPVPDPPLYGSIDASLMMWKASIA